MAATRCFIVVKPTNAFPDAASPVGRPQAPATVRRVRHRGFTIAEVAVSVLVLALGISTSLAAMQRAYLALDTARNLVIAGSIMQNEIEKERLLAWVQVSDTTYQPVIDSSFLRNPAVAGRFTLSRSAVLLSQRSGQMVQVTLTVAWRTYDGRSLSRSYTTYFGQAGLYNYFYKNV